MAERAWAGGYGLTCTRRLAGTSLFFEQKEYDRLSPMAPMGDGNKEIMENGDMINFSMRACKPNGVGSLSKENESKEKVCY